MELQNAQLLANMLITKHLTPDWSFKWNNRVNSLGVCKYKHSGGGAIELSRKWTAASPKDEVRDTILHEIAHALAGRLAGHGYHWQQACLAIGALPERLAVTDVKRSDIAIATHKLVLITTGEVVQEYYRSPPESTYVKLKHMYLTGRKAETLGKLVIRETSLLDLMSL